jgi:probable addiction module antidote protein
MHKTDSYQKHLIEDLKDSQEAIGYLNAALEGGDRNVFLLALRNVAEAHGGLSKLARKTKLDRANLYKVLSKHGNPEIGSLENILKALGLRLAIVENSPTKRAA